MRAQSRLADVHAATIRTNEGLIGGRITKKRSNVMRLVALSHMKIRLPKAGKGVIAQPAAKANFNYRVINAPYMLNKAEMRLLACIRALASRKLAAGRLANAN